MSDRRDYVIVGGGLSGGLIALALRHFQPQASITIVERDNRPGGNHTWAFHAHDVPPSADEWFRPLVVMDWPCYRVQFPGYKRDVSSAYGAISSQRLAEVLDRSGCELRMGTESTSLLANQVTLMDGTVLHGRCVIDARGPSAHFPLCNGFQKFVGLEVETCRPWPDRNPTVMDADVVQDDGFHFIYALPFSPTRVLVEDTYFSDTPEMDRSKLHSRVEEYLDFRGIASWRVIREEGGVLPMPWAGQQVTVDPDGPLIAGYAGGWFHPATGYSLPLAVRLALAIASVHPEQAATAAGSLARRLAPCQWFGRFLNRLLFTLVTPQERWQVFRRLYRSLPDTVMNRFYSCEFDLVDGVRLLLGWPPPLSPSRLIHRPEVRPCPLPSP